MEINLEKEFNSFLSINQKAAINAAATIAEKYNFKIFLIGGIVRDLIMQNQIKDIDITVVGNAIDFCGILEKESKYKIISTQDNLKTAKVIYENGVEIDFASTREEIYPQAGHLPLIKNFGCDLNSDVKRRDFTINTLAISLLKSDKYCLVDNYNGYNDIQNKQIKILHDKSFVDDPSRIIRALKFMLRFDFNIEENTYSLMQNYLKNVDKTSPLERVKNELKQYFSTDNPKLYEKIIETNTYKLISDNVILQFNADYFNEIKKYNLFDDKNKWFLYFLLLIFKSDFATERLNLNSTEKKVIQDLKSLYSNRIKNDNYSVYKNFIDKEDLAIAGYYIITGNNYVIKFLEELKGIKVLITGNDLISLGLKPSPLFNEIFDFVLKEKLNGNLRTKEEEITFVKKLQNH